MIDSPVPAGSAPAASSRSDLFRRGARLIGRSLRAHPVPHGIAIAGGAAFAVAVIALSRALGWVTDEVIVPGLDEGIDVDVWGAVGLLMAVGAFRGLGAVVRRYFLAVAEFRTEGTWRSQLNGQYLDLPLAEIELRPTGELLAHVDNDLTVAGMVLKPLAFTFATLVLAALALVSLWLVHPLFFAVALVVFPALALMNHLYTIRVEGPAARAQAAVGEVSSIAHESFDGVLVVKTLGRESDEVERLRRASDRLRGERIRVGRLRAVFEPTLDALPNLGIVALVAVGAWLVSDEAISVGDVVGATALFTILALPIRIVGFFLEEMPKSVVALDRIDRILDLPRPAEREGSVVLPDRPLDVAFEQVRFSWEPGTPVLDGVTFDVPAGSSVALVGSTGVGKSTLSELLVGLLPVESGTIRIGGVDLADVTPASLAASVTLVFQETFLFAESVAENIRLGADVSDETVRHVCELVRAHEFVTALPEGYDTVVGERGVTLSGGQRQRIALARALVRSPRVLFLDDATSAVDPSVEASILGNLRRELDLTLLVGAHRLSTIRLADRVVYLAEGRVAGIGSHAELLADPGYEALVRAYEEDRA